MRRPGIFLGGVATVLYAFLYAPIAVVIVFSFNAARFGAEWKGFDLRWYRVLWENAQALEAARNTLLLAATSTAIATVLGTLLGYGLSRHRFGGHAFFTRLLHVPMFIPDIVMAVAMLSAFSLLRGWLGRFELGLGTMILAHVTFQIPFVAIVIRARLADADPQIEEAAADLGARPSQIFRRVTLPFLWPGILAGGLLAFTLSLDDFVVSFFTSGPGSTTLPILIYSSVKRGLTPDINALSTLIVLVSTLSVVTVTWLRSRPRQARRSSKLAS